MYVAPQIEDYGTLEELTADISLLSPHGIGGTIAAVTGPLGGGPSPGGSQGVQNVHNAGSGDVGNLNSSGGGGAPAGDVSPGSAGGGAGPGGGGGGAAGGAAGSHAAQLPFTGFPAAFAGAIGGVMAASGAAIRRALRSNR